MFQCLRPVKVCKMVQCSACFGDIIFASTLRSWSVRFPSDDATSNVIRLVLLVCYLPDFGMLNLWHLGDYLHEITEHIPLFRMGTRSLKD